MMQRPGPRFNTRMKGFTLLEMIVAIGIFAIIAAISYASFDRFLTARTLINSKHEQLKQLQTTMTLMEQDIRFMVGRAVRDGFGDSEAAVIAGDDVGLEEDELLRLTTSRPLLGQPEGSRVQRVAWRLQDGELKRVTWIVLDRDQDSTERVRTVLDGIDVATLEFYAYAEDGQLLLEPEWVGDVMPAGVTFELTMLNGQQYRRVIAVAGNS